VEIVKAVIDISQSNSVFLRALLALSSMLHFYLFIENLLDFGIKHIFDRSNRIC